MVEDIMVVDSPVVAVVLAGVDSPAVAVALVVVVLPGVGNKISTDEKIYI